MPSCYRHPSQETGVSCSSCGRPICPDCMTPTPVGMRCPKCSAERTQVRTIRSLESELVVTKVMILLSVIGYVLDLLSSQGVLLSDNYILFNGGLYGPAVALDDEYWRILTAGFLHAGFIHLALNMVSLWFLGQIVETALGTKRFALLCITSLLGGSFGALLLSPLALTVGASGAVFGLMGAAVVIVHRRGLGLMESGIGIWLGMNLLITFTVSGISIGGHLGGLAAGFAVAWLLLGLEDQLPNRSELRWLPTALVVALAVLLAVGGVAVAGLQI